MHLLPHASPPVPFEGFGPRRHAGFGGRTPLPCKDRRVSLSRPDPKRKVTLPEIEPSGAPEVTPCLKELIMFKAQQGAKSDPSSAPGETSYANDSSQKRKPCQMTSKVQPPAKKRKYKPRKTVSSDDHRLKEQSADSRLQEAGENMAFLGIINDGL
ncbi:hypothetical protein ZWY2020_000629 [Hordeum vulgare]|nr:hypothetical protein ZWY2020_000629 [Hordeum vulgare]